MATGPAAYPQRHGFFMENLNGVFPRAGRIMWNLPGESLSQLCVCNLYDVHRVNRRIKSRCHGRNRLAVILFQHSEKFQ
jgi:hypothetical protein